MCSSRDSQSQCGAVLILVLIVLAGLAVLAVEFNRDALQDHMLSASSRSILASRPLFEAGELAASSALCGPLSKEKFDDGKAAWEHLDEGLKLLSRELRGGELSGTLEDENSFFPLRSLFPMRKSDLARAEACQRIFMQLVARRLLDTGIASDEMQAEELAEAFRDSLLQWSGLLAVDKVSEEWYLQQIPRRYPPGRPPFSAEELLLVYWPGLEPEKAHIVLAGTKEHPGLIGLISIASPGPMNIDTLRPEIIESLPPDRMLGKQLARQIVELRRYPDRIESRDWYRALFESHEVPVFPAGCVEKGSRWYRLTQKVRQGGRENIRISIGWIGSRGVKWEYRCSGWNRSSIGTMAEDVRSNERN